MLDVTRRVMLEMVKSFMSFFMWTVMYGFKSNVCKIYDEVVNKGR